MPLRDRTELGPAYCPHCFLQVEAAVAQPWPPALVRCPHCRLTIGPGRAHATPEDASPGARSTAAGVFAHDAKVAGAEAPPVSKERVRDGIRAVAERSGSRPDRLLMVEYQQRAAVDEDLPPLSEIFAAFGSWKQARRAAAH